MSKILHFVSGMPRSCSTLLCNLLAQNPRVHATASSPLHEIGYVARTVFKCDEAKGMDPAGMETLYLDYVKAGCEGAFDRITDRPIVADKNRSWVGHLDQLFKIWSEAKVLVPVRDMRGILSSMEKIFRLHPSFVTGVEAQSAQNWTTTEKRAQGWLASPPVGIATERVYEASKRFKKRLLFVHAEDLTSDPKSTMQKVWEYLGEDFDKHDFDNVAQYTVEHEVGWPYGDHAIRPQVGPLKPDWHDTLGRQLSEQINQKFNWINSL